MVYATTETITKALDVCVGRDIHEFTSELYEDHLLSHYERMRKEKGEKLSMEEVEKLVKKELSSCPFYDVFLLKTYMDCELNMTKTSSKIAVKVKEITTNMKVIIKELEKSRK